MYESYKHLIFGNLPGSKDILSVLSSDLKSIDVSVLDNIHEIIDEIIDEDERLKELAILCRDKIYSHPEWSLLAGRIRMVFIHRNTPLTFVGAVEMMKPVLGDKFYKFCVNNSIVLEAMIDRNLDWNFDIFATETLIKGYLTKINDNHGKSHLVETPQYKNLRIAAYLWYETNDKLAQSSLGKIKQTYLDISYGRISPASPTQFNAGMKRPQLASCFLQCVSDNIESLSKSWHDSAIISMINGGIGMVFDSIRHSEIGNSGWSKGIVPWIKIQNEVLSTVDQCFHPDTIVYTVKNGPKRIADIGPGEVLIRSDGQKNKVLQPIEYDVHSSNEFYELYSSESSYVVVSGCHPLLCIPKFHELQKKMVSGQVQPSYTDVKDIQEGDFLALPIPLYEKDLPKYSNDDCRFYGLLIQNRAFGFSKFSNLSEETFIFVRDYLTTRGIAFQSTSQLDIQWQPKHHLLPFTKGMVGRVYETVIGETVDIRFLPCFLHLPIEKLRHLVVGIFDGLKDLSVTAEPDSFSFTETQQVIESIRYILLRLSIYSSVEVLQSHWRRLRIPKSANILKLLGRSDDVIENDNYHVYDNKIWYPLVKKSLIQTEHRIKNVYDLEMELVEDVHSEITSNYMTAIGIAHNGGKRKGSGCMYLTDWHTDIFEFIDLKEPFGKEELRAKDLFYGIQISDLFMKRVEEDGMWTLFCPAKTNGLEKTSGREFEKRYLELEKMIIDGGYLSGTKRIKARELWTHILNSQISTGMPFICYKDSINRKSNQQHMGTLRTSNLCVEINEFVDEDHIASCNLSSIPISKFVKTHPKNGQKYFDFDELGQVTRRVVRNLGQTINRNYYPKDVPQIKYCNMRTRPLGIGIQDLAGCFALMDLCWDSPEAKALNEKIARVMYYHGMDENVSMAEELGSYETFPGSPASKGLFQFDLWNLEKLDKMKFGILEDVNYSQLIDIAGKILCYKNGDKIDLSTIGDDEIQKKAYLIQAVISQLKEVFGGVPCDELDWETLRDRMVRFGLYFSLLFAQMPTASSAQILGNNESIECYTQLLYARTVLSGQFAIVISYLVKDLEAIDMWNNDILKYLLTTQGSIQGFPLEDVPLVHQQRFIYLQKKYRTAFELSQKVIANLYLDRAKYQCQASSNNVFMKAPTLKSLNAYHFYMWKGGAKTGMYYLRQMTKSNPLNFALSDIRMATVQKESPSQESNGEEEGECLMCGS